MPELLQIGSFMIQSKLLIAFTAGISAYYAMLWKLKQSEVLRLSPRFLEILMNGAWIVILIWKFGPLLTHPSLVVEHPLMILLINGGREDLLIGLLAASIYLIYRIYRESMSYRSAGDLLSYGAIVFVTILMTPFWEYGRATDVPWGITVQTGGEAYHPVNVYMLLAGLIVLGRLLMPKPPIGSGRHLKAFLITFGILLFGISLTLPPAEGWVLSPLQLVSLVMAGVGYVLPPLRIIAAKGDDEDMEPNGTQDSMAQKRQQKENQNQTQNHGKDKNFFVDKHLDGPNRPST
ncbi:hypothetical protein [Marinicrinis sediminis]|uniref:Prolipoprotein diacylglyceryl transferase n=1 Tax=Marinicrinis sediminis TaxID=1652465 RepID=A0ABW5REU7_9BACL